MRDYTNKRCTITEFEALQKWANRVGHENAENLIQSKFGNFSYEIRLRLFILMEQIGVDAALNEPSKGLGNYLTRTFAG